MAIFPQPIPFKEADAFLASRQDRPTALKARELAIAWDAQARQAAFFSARVIEAAVLSRLHAVVEQVTSGQLPQRQAVRLLREYLLGDGADALSRMGFAPARGAQGLAQLASIPRLSLIVYQNVKMAQERGHYAQWKQVSQDFPYGIWRCGHAENHRDEHLARDGKAYPFDHPIWTQSPPGGEYNCHCRRELATAQDLRERGISPEPPDSPFLPSSLGFDPSREPENPSFPKTVRPEYEARARQKLEEDQRAIDEQRRAREQEQARLQMQEAARQDAERQAREEATRIQNNQPQTVEPAKTGVIARIVDWLRDKIGGRNLPDDSEVMEMIGWIRKDPHQKCHISDKEIKEASDDLCNLMGIPEPLVNANVRSMTEIECKNHPKRMGSCQRIGKTKPPVYEIAINPDCKTRHVTLIHEMAHAYIEAGIIKPALVKAIFKEVQKEPAYKEAPELWGQYTEKQLPAEWVVRAIAFVATYDNNNQKKSDRAVALLTNDVYSIISFTGSQGLLSFIRRNLKMGILNKIKHLLHIFDDSPPKEMEPKEKAMAFIQKTGRMPSTEPEEKWVEWCTTFLSLAHPERDKESIKAEATALYKHNQEVLKIPPEERYDTM